MTNRELDVLIIGFSVGSLASLWLGYHLRKRVERWQTRRRQRADLQHDARKSAKHIPFGDLSSVFPAKQDARQGMRRQEIISLKPRDSEYPTLRRTRAPMERVIIPIIKLPSADNGYHVPSDNERVANTMAASIPSLPYDQSYDREPMIRAVEETAHAIRTDAVAALTGAGYKLRDALAALDACMLVERAGGLESWVAAALRRLTNTLRDTK